MRRDDAPGMRPLSVVKVRVDISYNNQGSIIWHYLQDLACSSLRRCTRYHHYINATEDATVLRQPVFSSNATSGQVDFLYHYRPTSKQPSSRNIFYILRNSEPSLVLRFRYGILKQRFILP